MERKGKEEYPDLYRQHLPLSIGGSTTIHCVYTVRIILSFADKWKETSQMSTTNNTIISPRRIDRPSLLPTYLSICIYV